MKLVQRLFVLFGLSFAMGVFSTLGIQSFLRWFKSRYFFGRIEN